MSTASAPVEIGHVALKVRDLPGVAAFYENLLGLQRLSGDDATVRLGAGNRLLLELRGDKAARPGGRREAGLFHTAFLMPSRAALGRWLIHAADSRAPLQGASDHLVSEAIYLADPEGNGIEVYADRPRSAWYDSAGSIKMATEALDLNGLAAAADGPWSSAPDGLVVGHIHLQAGDVARAETFWRDTVGLPVMAHYPGAAFFGSGGYHHHIAANVWNSRGAGPRDEGATGLAELVLAADPAKAGAMTARTGSTSFADPWGIRVTIEAKAA